MSIESLAVVLFVLILGFAALLVLGTVMPYISRGRPPDPMLRAGRIRQVREARKMERRRGRVWWNVDSLHAEYVARTSAVQPRRAAPVEAADPTPPDGGVTRDQVDQMFATFLNERGGKADRASGPEGQHDTKPASTGTRP